MKKLLFLMGLVLITGFAYAQNLGIDMQIVSFEKQALDGTFDLNLKLIAYRDTTLNHEIRIDVSDWMPLTGHSNTRAYAMVTGAVQLSGLSYIRKI